MTKGSSVEAGIVGATQVPRWLMPAIVVAGVVIRLALLPSVGFAGDIDQFVAWVGHIARDGLGHAYDVDISFGPVMAFVWWILGLLDPGLAGAVDSADPAVRVVMKLPAVVADLGLAITAWYALRARPRWAAAAVGVILVHPAVWFVSAWWGTYDSIFVAFAMAALVLAIRNRDVPAVAALVLAVMTKPQAAPLVVPFIGWFVARAVARANGERASRASGVAAARHLAVLAASGVVVLFLLWLPFLAANGPANYLAGLGRYQGDLYGYLSLAAWNPWWLVQELTAGGNYLSDGAAAIGGLSFRVIGYVATLLVLAVIAAAVARRPTPRMLALGVATSALAAYEMLTAMHERYAFAVLPILALLLDDRRIRWAVVVFGSTFFLNLVSASAEYMGGIVPLHGPVTVAGSIVNVAVLVFLLLAFWRDSRSPEPAAAINEGAESALRRMPRGTSAGSAEATSAA